jgi:hypothetical protein
VHAGQGGPRVGDRGSGATSTHATDRLPWGYPLRSHCQLTAWHCPPPLQFVHTIEEGTPLASKGAVDDSTSDNEPLWLSIAKGPAAVNDDKFIAAGGEGPSGTRTIAKGWTYVEIAWLVKIKTDSEGNVHYEAWSQPHGERTVLTKSKILSVRITWLREDERRNALKRYVMSAAMYQRLVEAVRPHQ